MRIKLLQRHVFYRTTSYHQVYHVPVLRYTVPVLLLCKALRTIPVPGTTHVVRTRSRLLGFSNLALAFQLLTFPREGYIIWFFHSKVNLTITPLSALSEHREINIRRKVDILGVEDSHLPSTVIMESEGSSSSSALVYKPPQAQSKEKTTALLMREKEQKNALILKQSNERDVTGIYRSVYPYNHLDGEKVKHFTDTVGKCLAAQDLIHEHTGFFSGFDCLVVALRFLQDSCGLEFQGMLFIDCIGCTGSTSIYAKCFEFKETVSIEVSKRSSSVAADTMHSLAGHLKIDPHSSSFIVGSLQDYFRFDADIVYMDCTVVGVDAMVDEGVLVLILFALLKRSMPGTCAIVVTAGMDLSTRSCAALGGDHMQCIYEQQVPRPEFDHVMCNLAVLKVFS